MNLSMLSTIQKECRKGNKMYCSKCGKEIEKEGSYCAFCGNDLENGKKPLYDLKPKKTAWQAILLYLSALIIEFLSLILLVVVIVLGMQTLGIKIDISEFKIQTKKWAVFLNPLFAIIFSFLIMHAKNLFGQKRAIVLAVLSAVISFLIGSIVGFIFIAIMTRFAPKEIETV